MVLCYAFLIQPTLPILLFGSIKVSDKFKCSTFAIVVQTNVRIVLCKFSRVYLHTLWFNYIKLHTHLLTTFVVKSVFFKFFVFIVRWTSVIK